MSGVRRLVVALLVRALERASWKVYGEEGAAADLGLRPTTLTSRMRKMGIRKPGA